MWLGNGFCFYVIRTMIALISFARQPIMQFRDVGVNQQHAKCDRGTEHDKKCFHHRNMMYPCFIFNRSIATC